MSMFQFLVLPIDKQNDLKDYGLLQYVAGIAMHNLNQAR